ncbi:ArsR/SmtB family transcription factor [Rhodococcus qingshengii]|uniref:ArsR/SmtB family transcription factor n=1 Tax=Rhodococcus qingshengii TaxID=334542 RepID=UPI001C6024BE|nr:metalloregulator ArsR/SmtB family transcription factor [Rhodococcus qingshengii]MBW4818772.1 metalloregulator ArsR/SmtB family transcription factor [Rhodococcus qingshengii]
MGHRVRDEVRSLTGLNSALAETVAETLQALTSPNRLLILWRLSESPCSVSELAEAVGMEPSAVSHQLRILRSLGLVVGVRSGRTVEYSIFDLHVAALLTEAVYHVEHLRLGARDQGGRAP